MKVLGISGSARKDGNTAIIIGKVFEELTAAGIETELIQLSQQEIEPCNTEINFEKLNKYAIIEA